MCPLGLKWLLLFAYKDLPHLLYKAASQLTHAHLSPILLTGW
jgi:hypothetical protein